MSTNIHLTRLEAGVYTYAIDSRKFTIRKIMSYNMYGKFFWHIRVDGVKLGIARTLKEAREFLDAWLTYDHD